MCLTYFFAFAIGTLHLFIVANVESKIIIQDSVRKESYKYSALKDDKQLQEGQLNYNLVVRDSQMPRYGSCWKNALKELEHGCKHLTDDLQRFLALKFTNCFLEKVGQTTYPCENDEDISVCLSQMNNNGFTAFTNFFTHTQSMCYFLQTQVWQEETENTVAKLTDNSIKVVKTLEDTNELQDAILEAQRKSLFQQERLLESSSQLGIALDMSKDNVKDMLDEFRLSTNEQRNMIFEVFDRLSKLQNLVLGEVSGFYSLIFYPTALLTVYLLTSTSRTAAARFWLFVLFGCSLALERCIVHLTVSDDCAYVPADEASKEMYWRIWLVRKSAMLLCIVLLAHFAYKFQDYNLINNTLLMQIQRQNLELKGYFESMGGIGNSNLLSSDVIDFGKKKFNADFSDSSDSEFSYDSEASDGTYVPSSDDDAFITAKSRSSSVVPSPESMLHVSFEEIKKGIKTERPALRSSRSSRCNTPVIQSAYNLRSRSNLRSLNTSNMSNEVINESPEVFGRKVKEMERITRHNARQIIQSVKKTTPSYFSSDDECL
ncbi:Uncharacterized protein APZ42_016809 [Daphnia magna]|uniref:Mitochondrial ribosomal protein VAR1 n=1 Tax=Daphnia magna TaxID=35525 RepID=A0A165A5W6_9CRUS|nr:Uncharacterized protein APZ42_016809 [Daphnia magna]